MASEGFEVEVEGIEEVCSLLTDAPKDIARLTFGRAITSACVPVFQTLSYTAPELTGDMVDHLVTDIRVANDGSGASADIGFGSQGWKARLVELGHRAIGHKPGLKELAIGRVPAHPFMRPAAESSAEASVQAFADSVQSQLGSRSIADLKVA